MARDFTRNLGDKIKLRGPRGAKCSVMAPSGLEMLHPPASNGRIQVTLDQPGEWWYEWSDDGPNGSIHVGQERTVVADSGPDAVPPGPVIDIGRIEAS